MEINLPAFKSKIFLLANISVCLISTIYWLIVIYPGKYSTDNAMMLAESFPHVGIGNQHSVMFIWLLSVCHKLWGYHVGYPTIWGLICWILGVLFFTQAIFTLTKSYWSIVFAFVFFHLPYIVFIFPYLQIKDFSMSAALFAGFGILFYSDTNSNKAYLFTSLLFFFVAICFRHNGIFVFLAPAVFIAIIFLRLFSKKKMVSRSIYYFKVSLQSALIVTIFLYLNIIFDASVRDYRNYFT